MNKIIIAASVSIILSCVTPHYINDEYFYENLLFTIIDLIIYFMRE